MISVPSSNAAIAGKSAQFTNNAFDDTTVNGSVQLSSPKIAVFIAKFLPSASVQTMAIPP